jgi:hypothetical protein
VRAKAWLALVSLLATTLCGCNILLPAEPPVTWVPLPTVAPATTATLPAPTAVPTAAATVAPTKAALPTAEPTRAIISGEAVAKAAKARDTAWEFMVSKAAAGRFPAKLAWAGRGTTAGGNNIYRYQADTWQATVSVSSTVPLDQASHLVTFSGPDNYGWNGQVGADNQVQVVAPGAVAQIATPGAVAQVATPGATTPAAIKTAAPGATASAAPTSAPLAATATARPAAPTAAAPVAPIATAAPASEVVEGWVGRVRAAPAGQPYAQYFDAQTPRGQFGITSLVPKLAQDLAAYRNTTAVIRVWGVLDHGVADFGGQRIVVTRIELVSE